MTILPPLSFDRRRSPARPVAHDVLDLARMAALDRGPREVAANDARAVPPGRTALRAGYASVAALPQRFRVR